MDNLFCPICETNMVHTIGNKYRHGESDEDCEYEDYEYDLEHWDMIFKWGSLVSISESLKRLASHFDGRYG